MISKVFRIFLMDKILIQLHQFYQERFFQVMHRQQALLQYKEAKEDGRYKQIAQKLAQHLQNLAEDPNVRTRWIWELIQNAKDVSNQFNRAKIIIQITDNSLSFSHNGDPFRPKDIEKIVTQYSSKAQQNKIEQETTGKYGTGFITTYILSRKLSVQGLIKISVKDRKHKLQFSDSDDSDQDKKSKKVKQSKKEQFDPNKEYFQRFSFKLDRSYNNRDDDFERTLLKTQHKLMKKLQQWSFEQAWARREDDFDTTFVYKEMDSTGLKIASQGINTLKTMFPYALLFNPKLQQIRVLDKRAHRVFDDFKIFRCKQETLGPVKISVCKIVQKGEEQTIRLAYLTNQESVATVAVPIQIRDRNVALLQVDKQIPKIFKEFPLIGAKDTGYNYVFTSRKFYPNETRSNLMLRIIEGRPSHKTKQNWQVLHNVFNTGISLYQMLSHVINQHRQNFFSVRVCPFLGNETQSKFQEYFNQFRMVLWQLPVMLYRNGKTGSLSNLIYIAQQSSQGFSKSKEFSGRMNEIFAFMYDENRIPSLEFHQSLFQFITSPAWNEAVQFERLGSCLNKFVSIPFSQYVDYFRDKTLAHDKLKQIYEVLKQHAPQYLDYKNKCQLKLFLNNNQQFIKIEQSYSKHNLPIVYQNLLQLIGIHKQTKAKLIQDDFRKYFINIPIFSIQQAQKEIESYFFSQDMQISILIRFMKTLKLGEQITQLACQLKEFSKLQPFKIDVMTMKPLSNTAKQKYIKLYRRKIINYMSYFMKNFKQLKQLIAQLIAPTQTSPQLAAIKWFDLVLHQQTKMSINPPNQKPFKFNLSWSCHFKKCDQLRQMAQYPDEIDIAIYDYFKFKANQGQKLKQQLMHPKMTYSQQIGKTQFSILFAFIPQYYNSAKKLFGGRYNPTDEDKIKILQYTDKLTRQCQNVIDQNKRDKLKVFQQLRKIKHQEILKLMTITQQQADFIYNMVVDANLYIPELSAIVKKVQDKKRQRRQ